jgi:hypothetical protein
MFERSKIRKHRRMGHRMTQQMVGINLQGLPNGLHLICSCGQRWLIR